MIEGEKYHIFEEKPLRFTEKGLEELIKKETAFVDFQPFDAMIYGHEIFHVNGDGVIRQIAVNSKKGQELLSRRDEENI